MNSAPAPSGRSPLLSTPLPSRSRWGDAELKRLTEMVGQKSLFYWNGAQTAALTEEFQRHYPFKYVFPCSSGTGSLHIAVAALRLRPGEEVVVSPITDMGSVIGILYQQGVPVFADLDPRTYNLDPEAVRRAITSKTRAIMAVHLAGNPCDLTALSALARAKGLSLIEDCAQSWGARHQGRPVGLWGDFGCYSFNDFKHLSCGDGGIVATNSDIFGPSLGKWGDKSYDRVGAMKDPALLRDPADLAPNYRISEPQAAVAASQLTKLTDIVAQRNRAGDRLTTQLANVSGVLPPITRPGDLHSYWFYFLRLDLPRLRVGRDDFVSALRAEGLPANAGYIPKPVYRYRVFQTHNFFGGAWPARDSGLTTMDYREVKCPVAEAILNDGITFPLNEAMADVYIDQVAHVIGTVAARLAG